MAIVADPVRDIAYDCGTAKLRIGARAVGGVQSMSFPDETVKMEKLRALGQQYATIRTQGVIEIGDGEIEITTVGWADLLSVLPDNFGSVEFPITVAQVHPQIAGPYSVIWDRCKIIGRKEKIETSEKAGLITIPLNVIMVLQKGYDGSYKTIGLRPGQRAIASLDAQALF